MTSLFNPKLNSIINSCFKKIINYDEINRISGFNYEINNTIGSSTINYRVNNAYNYLRVKSDKSGSEWTRAIDDASKIGTSTLANDLVTAGAINTALSGKVNVSQGAENKDKIFC